MTQHSFTSEADLEGGARHTERRPDRRPRTRGGRPRDPRGRAARWAPTLAMLARRGMDAAGRQDDAVYAVSRFGECRDPRAPRGRGREGRPVRPDRERRLHRAAGCSERGVHGRGEVRRRRPTPLGRGRSTPPLPTASPAVTRDSAISVLSTGNVYPFLPASSAEQPKKCSRHPSASMRSRASVASACSSSGRRSAAPRSRSSASTTRSTCATACSPTSAAPCTRGQPVSVATRPTST